MSGVSMGKTCRLVRTTGKAVLVATPDHGDVWVPEACVHGDSEIFGDCKPGLVGELVVVVAFAEQKGWA